MAKYALAHRESLVRFLIRVTGARESEVRFTVNQVSTWCLLASEDRRVRFLPRVALRSASLILGKEAGRLS